MYSIVTHHIKLGSKSHVWCHDFLLIPYITSLILIPILISISLLVLEIIIGTFIWLILPFLEITFLKTFM
jgi:hypothetical protein